MKPRYAIWSDGTKISLTPRKKRAAKDPLIHGRAEDEEPVMWDCPRCSEWMGGFMFVRTFKTFVQCTRCLNEFARLK